jgi:hypothetical protein
MLKVQCVVINKLERIFKEAYIIVPELVWTDWEEPQRTLVKVISTPAEMY